MRIHVVHGIQVPVHVRPLSPDVDFRDQTEEACVMDFYGRLFGCTYEQLLQVRR